jgi:hydrogenase expression/formation protein HypC
MCFELPSKIISIKDKEATVDFLGQQGKVSLVLVDDVKLGDYVMVKGGLAVSKVKKEEAKEIISLLKKQK